jgi:hypothetical protein
MFRLTNRDVLWLTVLLALSVGWLCFSWSLWIERPVVEHDERPPEEAISEYRQLLNNLN